MLVSPIRGLLKSVSDATTVQDVLEAIGANFTAEKRDIYYECVNGDKIRYDRAKVIVNKDTEEGISICSDGYGIVQYVDAISFLNSLVVEGKARFDTAGITDRGARLHVIMKADDYVDIGNGEKIDFYFYVVTSHDSTASICTMVTPLHNLTQTVFTPIDNGVVKFKHSRNVNERMKKAANIYTKMNKEWQEYSDNFKNWVKVQLNPIQLDSYFKMVCPGDTKQAENTRAKLVDIFRGGALSSLNSCKGSLWGAFMAVQQFADFYKTTKKSSKGRSEVEARIEGRLSGAAARQKATAYGMAMRFAANSRL